MVNDVRTCLLNLAAWSGSDRPPGEEYVPADYAPRPLAGDLARARLALLGVGADRAGANLTLARLLANLHASDFAADLVAADARLSYDPARPAEVWEALGPSASGPSAVPGWAGSATFVAPGRGYGRWTVAADGAGAAVVTPAAGPDGPPATVAVDPAALGDAVGLPGTDLAVVLPAATAGTWTVALVAAPAHCFAAAAELPDAAGLFRPRGGEAEARWAAAWTGGGDPAYRAMALAMALAARVRERGA